METFTRSKLNPILKPDPSHAWEDLKLYNPGAIYHDGKYHLFYRAVNEGDDWRSSIGYAVSGDGENFERFPEPLLVGETEMEKRGLEDPRITIIDDILYMTYAAYDGKTPRLSIATSSDLGKWEKRGTAFKTWKFSEAGGCYAKFMENGVIITKAKDTEWSKSGGIFPEKIGGKFMMLFGEFDIWFATSDDGVNWQGDYEPFLAKRDGEYFDNVFVEMGPPPIKTDNGWLVLYHGINKEHSYQIGFLLLDLENPRKIIYRSNEPIFSPREPYEISGLVDVLPIGLDELEKMEECERRRYLLEAVKKHTMPKVVFCCGAVVIDDTLRIYYGAADSVICTATAKLSDILGMAR